MKTLLSVLLTVVFMVFLASVATADELYPVRVYDHASGSNSVRGEVVSVDQVAGQMTVAVKSSDINTLLPGVMTLRTDSMTQVKMCDSSKTFEDIKVGERVEVKYQARDEGEPIAKDIHVINKTC